MPLFRIESIFHIPARDVTVLSGHVVEGPINASMFARIPTKSTPSMTFPIDSIEVASGESGPRICLCFRFDSQDREFLLSQNLIGELLECSQHDGYKKSRDSCHKTTRVKLPSTIRRAAKWAGALSALLLNCLCTFEIYTLHSMTRSGDETGEIDLALRFLVLAPPLLIVAMAGLWLTLIDNIRAIRTRAGVCPRCRYNRVGLDSSSPCPE